MWPIFHYFIQNISKLTKVFTIYVMTLKIRKYQKNRVHVDEKKLQTQKPNMLISNVSKNR